MESCCTNPSFPELGILAWEGSALLAETLTVRGASGLGPRPWPLLLAALIWGFPLVLVVRTPFAIKTWRLFQLGFLGHFLGLLRVPGCDRAPGAGVGPGGLGWGPSPSRGICPHRGHCPSRGNSSSGIRARHVPPAPLQPNPPAAPKNPEFPFFPAFAPAEPQLWRSPAQARSCLAPGSSGGFGASPCN